MGGLTMICLIYILPILLQISTVIANDVLMNVDYETGDLSSGYPELDTHPPLPDRAQVDTLARNSSFAVFHQLYSTDPSVAGSKRCESDNMKMVSARVRVGEEVFYGFSIYIPSTWEFDGDLDDILIQWKGFGGGPFMFITQKHEGLFLRINANTDPDYDLHPENMIKTQHTIITSLKRGQWHDFRLQVIWDFALIGFGFVAVDYKTAEEVEYERVVSVIGPNMYNKEGYLKWGIYKPAWQAGLVENNVTRRKVWHDNVRIGPSWDLVDPAIVKIQI